MIDHFPSSYQHYVRTLHMKERQQAIKKANKNKKMMSIRQTNALKKAMKDSSEYNSILLHQRREERASYYDMQTQLIHIPKRRNRKLPAHMTVPSKYPVALLPGQYQDYYYRYSPSELSQFPLNSVVTFPPPPQPEVKIHIIYYVITARTFEKHAPPLRKVTFTCFGEGEAMPHQHSDLRPVNFNGYANIRGLYVFVVVRLSFC